MTFVESARDDRASRSAPARAPYLPALDGLRGAAILGVLLFHTDRLPGGFLGVDLFFALSGYLITDLLLRETAATGSVSLAAFWGRRIRRLFPALAVMLAGAALLVRAFAPPDTVRSMLSDGPWVQANLVNWHLLAESAGYWDRFGAERVFEHLWSIAVEEQFYLVWPLVLVAVAHLARRRRGARRADGGIAVAAALASAVSLALMVLLVDGADPSRVYMGTDTRAFSLLLGAMVATGPVRAALARAVGRWAGAAAAVLAVGIAALWLVADGTDSLWLFTGGLFAHSLASALLIGLCAQAPRTSVARALSWRPLRWLGLVSYSLYLWHWPVIVLLSPERTGLDGWAWTATVGAVSVAAASLSKHLVEDPIRFRAGWARGRRGAVAFGAAMVALAVLWVAIPAPPPAAVDVALLE
ncbi:acyltransferase family protein [Nocardiopsis suaedae]|uniref:Acyltransferase n=1 Tax=Nocardiopsis suaedae TaxID=3018444 RepID=A0ABT4TF92_9ACTN|nr:acyltransferase [Nocardiopsis suaedae]MDA2803373.1 acyltransferase [Nocardiopsis suaedae]